MGPKSKQTNKMPTKKTSKVKRLTLSQRVARIEEWINFWETVPTPWKVLPLPKKSKHKKI